MIFTSKHIYITLFFWLSSCSVEFQYCSPLFWVFLGKMSTELEEIVTDATDLSRAQNVPFDYSSFCIREQFFCLCTSVIVRHDKSSFSFLLRMFNRRINWNHFRAPITASSITVLVATQCITLIKLWKT